MRVLSVVLCLALLTASSGCHHFGSTPPKPPVISNPPAVDTPLVVDTSTGVSIETQARLAYLAGGSAATIYIVIQHPPVDQVAVLRNIVDQISAAANSVPAGGFITLQSKFNALIDAQVGNPIGNIAARELVSALLVSLDGFISSHPTWAGNAQQVETLVANFCSGASTALADYKAKGLEQFKQERGITVEYSTAPVYTAPSVRSVPSSNPLIRFKDGCLNGHCPLKH